MTTVAGTIVQSIVAWVLLYTLPAVLLACAVYGRGDLQAFAIGALVPFAPMVIRGPAPLGSITGGLITFFNLLVTGGICGLAAAITRRWLIQSDTD